MYPVDYFNRPFKVGQIVVYTTNSGSTTRVSHGRILEIREFPSYDTKQVPGIKSKTSYKLVLESIGTSGYTPGPGPQRGRWKSTEPRRVIIDRIERCVIVPEEVVHSPWADPKQL
jgi:hypothetical protein